MKILAVFFRSRKHFKNFNLKDFDIYQEPYIKNGASKLTNICYVMQKFKNEVMTYMPNYTKSLNDEELLRFENLCKDVDFIICEGPDPIYGMTAKYEELLYVKILNRFRDKLRFCMTDPISMGQAKLNTKLTKKFWNDYNVQRFRNDRELVNQFIQFNRWLYYDAKKLLYTFYFHSQEEIKECYGEDVKNVYFMNTIDVFLPLDDKQIDFEEKENGFIYACLNPHRTLQHNKTFLKKFNIKPEEVKRIGEEKYARISKDNGLSEKQIYDAYNMKKFIISFPPGKPSLSWDRRRVLFAMMQNAVLLTSSHEAKYLGEPFRLDKNVFTLSDEELKRLAKRQKDYFFSHVMSKEQSEHNILQWLK